MSDRSKLMHFVCPVCNTGFSLMPSVYRSKVKTYGMITPCCSRSCGQRHYRARLKAAKVAAAGGA